MEGIRHRLTRVSEDVARKVGQGQLFSSALLISLPELVPLDEDALERNPLARTESVAGLQVGGAVYDASKHKREVRHAYRKPVPLPVHALRARFSDRLSSMSVVPLDAEANGTQALNPSLLTQGDSIFYSPSSQRSLSLFNSPDELDSSTSSSFSQPMYTPETTPSSSPASSSFLARRTSSLSEREILRRNLYFSSEDDEEAFRSISTDDEAFFELHDS